MRSRFPARNPRGAALRFSKSSPTNFPHTRPEFSIESVGELAKLILLLSRLRRVRLVWVPARVGHSHQWFDSTPLRSGSVKPAFQRLRPSLVAQCNEGCSCVTSERENKNPSSAAEQLGPSIAQAKCFVPTLRDIKPETDSKITGPVGGKQAELFLKHDLRNLRCTRQTQSQTR